MNVWRYFFLIKLSFCYILLFYPQRIAITLDIEIIVRLILFYKTNNISRIKHRNSSIFDIITQQP